MLHKKAAGEDTQCNVDCMGQTVTCDVQLYLHCSVHTYCSCTCTPTCTSNQSLPQSVIHIPCTHLTQRKYKITGKSQRAGMKVFTISTIITSSVIHTNHSHACKYFPHTHTHDYCPCLHSVRPFITCKTD